jgi:hypothetical protein
MKAGGDIALQRVLPVVEDARCFDVMVVGAKAGRGQLHWGCGAPVTKVIEDCRSWRSPPC